MEYTINWILRYRGYRLSSKITIFVSLMYPGSTLLYRQEVLVCTKSITLIKTKGGAILRLTEAINHPGGHIFLKGPSPLNLPYIHYVLALSLLTTGLYVIMFGNYVFFFALVGPTHWATMGAKYTSVETTWNPLALGCVLPLQVRLKSYHAF